MPAQTETQSSDLGESILDEITPEYPLSRWDVAVTATMVWGDGFVRYTVAVVNQDRQAIRRIVVRPEVLGEDFGSDAISKAIGPLHPGERGAVSFQLIPQRAAWGLGEGGGLILGRDVEVEATLQIRAGVPEYAMRLTNRLDYSLRFLRVTAVLPFDFISLDPHKEISLLPAGASTLLTFDLMERAHAQQLVEHLRDIRTPFLFGSGKPARRHRHFPRTYSKEELGEIRRKLLFLQMDDDLLRLIRDRPIMHPLWEVGHILPYEQLREHLPSEFTYWLRKFTIGEPIAMDATELSFDFELLYIEPTRSFPAAEVDFDIEYRPEAKPLDLEGAQLSDIELEPMEMEI